MSVTVVGSVALDTVDTPSGKNEEGLGGAATFFALAAANYTQVHLVAIIGTDFPQPHIDLLAGKGIDLEGLEKAEGATFRWAGHYHEDLNVRDTLDTQLNVFEHFHPKLPKTAQTATYLFLGNIHPALQLEVLQQATPKFTALDTMNLWIDISRDGLLEVLKQIDAIIINDAEVHDLTGERNLVKGAALIEKMGPTIIVIKKGEHGCLLFQDGQVFSAPALPMPEVIDPTGAGDTFAGGFLGYIASQDATDFPTLKKAVIHGSVLASYTCEAFGPTRLAQIAQPQIDERYQTFVNLAAF